MCKERLFIIQMYQRLIILNGKGNVSKINILFYFNGNVFMFTFIIFYLYLYFILHLSQKYFIYKFII